MTFSQKFWVSKLMVLKGLGKNYGDRVGRESIDEAIRGAQGSKNHGKPSNIDQTLPNKRPNLEKYWPIFGRFLRVWRALGATDGLVYRFSTYPIPIVSPQTLKNHVF